MVEPATALTHLDPLQKPTLDPEAKEEYRLWRVKNFSHPDYNIDWRHLHLASFYQVSEGTWQIELFYKVPEGH
jgi:hypothetical protein